MFPCVSNCLILNSKIIKAVWRGTNAINSWAWNNCDGNKAEIEVYADAYSVELFINGKSLGKKRIKEFKGTYKTKYAAGTIQAVACDQDGKKLSESELVSASGKTIIELKPEQTSIKVGELVYTNVNLVGENGIVESNDDRKLTVTIRGGTLLGFGSANPCTKERFDSGSYFSYYGKALAVARADTVGTLTLHVSGEGLDPAEKKIIVVN